MSKMLNTNFTFENIVRGQVQTYYIFGRNRERIYFVKQLNYPISSFGNIISLSIPTIGNLNISNYLFEQLFITKQWKKINNIVSNAIYDEEFQKEVNIALNIISITLPSL